MIISNRGDHGINCEEAEQTASAIQSPDLRPIAEMLYRNSYNLMCLLCLPDMLLVTGTRNTRHASLSARAFIRVRTKMGRPNSEQDRVAFNSEVDAEVKRLTEEAEKEDKVFDETQRLFADLLKTREVHEAVRVLLYALTSSAWAVFECAAKDSWIAALNCRPLQLAQPTLMELPKEPTVAGITGKQIEVGLLARYGFDLRDKLGTLLAPKFDFTSVSGMQFAFAAAFQGVPDIEQLLTDPKLSILEATRHLIVHRAGVIDEEYRRRTKELAATGQQLLISDVRATELANSAVSGGCKLLRAVDAWLIANPTITRDQST